MGDQEQTLHIPPKNHVRICRNTKNISPYDGQNHYISVFDVDESDVDDDERNVTRICALEKTVQQGWINQTHILLFLFKLVNMKKDLTEIVGGEYRETTQHSTNLMAILAMKNSVLRTMLLLIKVI